MEPRHNKWVRVIAKLLNIQIFIYFEYLIALVIVTWWGGPGGIEAYP